MKTTMMVKVVCGLALAATAACVDAGKLGATDELLTGSGSGSSTGSGAASAWHSTWNGHAAGLFSWGGTSQLSLQAFENGVGANQIDSLNFTYQGPDPTSQVCYSYYDWWYGWVTYCYYTQYITEYGWGQIPASDLQIAADISSAHLHTTTDANYVITKCTWNWWYWYQNCTTGGSETFDIVWNQNHASSSDTVGTTRWTWGAFTMQTQGSFSDNSADVSGTAIGGNAITGASGDISDSKGTNVSRDVFPSH